MRSSVRRTAPRQIVPTDRFRLPDIDLSRGRYILLAAGGGIFMLAVIFLLGQFKNDPVEVAPNAIWIGQEWTYETHTEDDVRNMTVQLRDHNIGRVYALVSFLNADGSWSGDPLQNNRFNEVEPAVMAFTEQFKRNYPASELYAWLIIPSYENRLQSNVLREGIVEFSLQLLNNMNFDGIFLNVDPIANNDQDFIALLRDMRAALGEGTPLAVAVPPDWTPEGTTLAMPPIYAPGTFWDEDFKRQIALLVDDITITAYNTGFNDGQDYSNWVAYQVETFGRAVSGLDGASITVGISTQGTLRDPATDLTIHNPAVENLSTALDGVRSGLAALGTDTTIFSGVAIFSVQTTDQSEWTLFRAEWVTE